MDILSHTLSGIAIGTVVSSFLDKGFGNRLGVIVIAGFGSILPDFDAISLWSKFDSIFGKLFGLNHSGKEIYFSKFWYSHHGFMHSLFASIIIALVFVFLLYLIKSKFNKVSLKGLIQNIKCCQLYWISFILGFLIHLLEDMVTPGSVWGGVNFFWPSNSYLGGTGDIWWWNNYDIFLIVLGVIFLNGFILGAKQFIKIDVRKLTVGIFILGFAFSLFQIKTREFDFAYKGHTSRYNEFEIKSKEIQKRELGTRLYNLMERFDNRIPINF